MRARIGFLAAVACICGALFAPAQAFSASAEFGQIQTSPDSNCGDSLLLQDVSTTPSYAAPFSGVVTRWRTWGGIGGAMKLKVFRTTAVAGSYLTVGSSASQPLTSGVENSFTTRFSVQQGDLLGMITAANTQCALSDAAFDTQIKPTAGDTADGSTAAFNEWLNQRLNIAATVETDADGDGFGDDTQDADDDNDGIGDADDNCDLASNPFQENSDGANDGGDACDADDDNDGVPDTGDNCRTVANADQVNADGDAQGDACDADNDNDGLTDGSETALGLDPRSADTDGDGKGDAVDACPKVSAPTADGCTAPTAPTAPDVTRPGLVVGALRNPTARAKFLRGLRASAKPREPATLEFQLLAVSSRLTLTRALSVVLARRSLPLAPGRRAVTLRPSSGFVLPRKGFKAQLVVVATDAAGNRTTARRTFRVR